MMTVKSVDVKLNFRGISVFFAYRYFSWIYILLGYAGLENVYNDYALKPNLREETVSYCVELFYMSIRLQNVYLTKNRSR